MGTNTLLQRQRESWEIHGREDVLSGKVEQKSSFCRGFTGPLNLSETGHDALTLSVKQPNRGWFIFANPQWAIPPPSFSPGRRRASPGAQRWLREQRGRPGGGCVAAMARASPPARGTSAAAWRGLGEDVLVPSVCAFKSLREQPVTPAACQR